MIDYEQAKKKAVVHKKDLDSALEYRDAYVFYSSKARGNAAEDSEVVVLKSDGRVVTMSQYVIGTKDSSRPKHIKF